MKRRLYSILCMLAATTVYALVVLQPWEFKYSFGYHVINGFQWERTEKNNHNYAVYSEVIIITPEYPESFNPNTDEELLNSPNPAKYLPKLPGWDYDKKTGRFFRTNLSRKDIQERAKIENYEDSVNSLLQ